MSYPLPKAFELPVKSVGKDALYLQHGHLQLFEVKAACWASIKVFLFRNCLKHYLGD